MKKIFTLALLAVSLLTANAESRKWDFTHWSAATIANLSKGLSSNFGSDAEALNPACGWSDIEKASGDKANQASAVGGKVFWEVKAQGNATTGAQLCADGQPIVELDGLLYTNTTARSLAIAIDKGSGYEGASYLWTGSKQKNYFVIPNVAPGAKITMGVESHNTAQARGYQLYIVPKGKYSTKGTKLKDVDGNDIPDVTTYVEKTWYVPEEGLSDTPNEDGTFDVLIYNTNGAHIYFINVDEGENIGENSKVAWIHNGSPEADLAWSMRPSDGFTFEDIDGTDPANVTDEILRGYDAVVIGSDVTTETPAYAQLQKNIAFVPMVNLSTSLFGYTPAGDATTMTAVDPTATDYWDAVSLDEGTVEYGANVSVTLPELFSNDEVIAKQGDAVAIHRHNNGAGKNSYFLLGSGGEVSTGDAWQPIFTNLLTTAIKSKRDVSAAATPSISLSYADQQTTATITCATGGSKIYYKEGEGDYQLYTAPILYTAETTITAYAESEGFLKSAEATKTVDIQTQAAAPTISVDQQDGKSILTLTADADATIYYSFSGQTKAANAATYTEPVEVTEPGKVTAFAVADGKLQSLVAEGDVRVKGIPEVTDTISHFTANEADWFTNAEVSTDGTTFTPLADAITEGTATGAAKAVYYFGKSSWEYYSDEVDHTETDPTTGDEVTIYKPSTESYRVVKSTSDTDWIIESNGQVITGETNVAAGSGVYTGTAGYFAEEAIDEIGGQPSKGKVDFGGKNAGNPYTMRVKSTKPFSGTFDVVAYLSNGGTSDLGIELQKSADGETWTTVGNLKYSLTQRLFKKTRFHLDEATPVYLRVAQVSGGSKGQLYDIYVIKTEGISTAISNVNADKANDAKVGKFVKDGRIYIQKGDALYNVAGAQVK